MRRLRGWYRQLQDSEADAELNLRRFNGFFASPQTESEGSQTEESKGTVTLIEGDIAYTQQAGLRMNAGAGLAQATWPNATVPYKISPEVNGNLVRSAIAHVSFMTDVKFIECADCGPAKKVDFLHFQKQSGCWSYIGYKAGWYVNDPAGVGLGPGQPVSVDATCSEGNMIHEISHALGLWHEHTRPDRDNYIVVERSNIQDNYYSNFQVNSGAYYYGDYDYGSVMHYGSTAFAIDTKKNSITTLDKSKQSVIGQRKGLSAKDVQAIRSLYGMSDVNGPASPTASPTTSPTFSGALGSNAGSKIEEVANTNVPYLNMPLYLLVLGAAAILIFVAGVVAVTIRVARRRTENRYKLPTKTKNHSRRSTLVLQTPIQTPPAQPGATPTWTSASKDPSHTVINTPMMLPQKSNSAAGAKTSSSRPATTSELPKQPGRSGKDSRSLFGQG